MLPSQLWGVFKNFHGPWKFNFPHENSHSRSRTDEKCRWRSQPCSSSYCERGTSVQPAQAMSLMLETTLPSSAPEPCRMPIDRIVSYDHELSVCGGETGVDQKTSWRGHVYSPERRRCGRRKV